MRKLLNLSHPLSATGKAIIETMVEEQIEEIIVGVELDMNRPIQPQVAEMEARVTEAVNGDTDVLWIPPELSLAAAAAIVVARNIGIPDRHMVVIVPIGNHLHDKNA